jgi:hypothetical protein
LAPKSSSLFSVRAECREAIASGRLVPDGKILLPSGQSVVAKAAIEPVWYLPEVARRFQTTESNLRQSIFRMTNGMYPELITRPDIKVGQQGARRNARENFRCKSLTSIFRFVSLLFPDLPAAHRRTDDLHLGRPGHHPRRGH